VPQLPNHGVELATIPRAHQVGYMALNPRNTAPPFAAGLNAGSGGP
jgi:hypothetical protein